ncbi:MAG: caspase family protein [Flavobacteriales bacterium]|nr:caspase family protein [Flavobacteriales bacterium]
MRKALIVGIDYYKNISQLYGCVNDSYNVKGVLERNSDGTLNFDIMHETASNESQSITRGTLKDKITQLFADDSEIALFYYAGHGYIENSGGYLVTSECNRGDDGLSLDEVLNIANNSNAKNKIIILDSCHSGIVGNISSIANRAILSEGVTILTASSESQYAQEEDGHGVFTTLLVDALNGSASNLVGEISPASVYAHIDQSLGAWEQRPIFKTNIKKFISLRKVQAPISLDDLKMITILFEEVNSNFQLDPTFEANRDNTDLEDLPEPIEDNVEKFRILQKFNRINLVIPVDEEHMYYAAMNSKSCKLTSLGEHYWNLVKKERI